MKTCRICNLEKIKEKFQKHRNVCKSCRQKQRKRTPAYIEQQKRYRKKHKAELLIKQREYSRKSRFKNGLRYKNTHSKLHYFLRKNDFQKPSCQICKIPNPFMHHIDYDKPLLVVFLCSICHSKVHSGYFTCPKATNLKNFIRSSRWQTNE